MGVCGCVRERERATVISKGGAQFKKMHGVYNKKCFIS